MAEEEFDPTDLDQRAHDYVRAGFYRRDEVIQFLIDEFCDEVDEGALRPMAVRATDLAIRDQKRAEETWPPLTDCDRLDLAFDKLDDSGIVARQNFTCCQNCGHAEIGEEIDEAAGRGVEVRGYTFYHQQDTDAAVAGDGVYLAYGTVGHDDTLKVAREIVAAIESCGLKTEWNGSIDKRILVAMEWRRRFPDG
jgi:hypothetical protein